MVGIVSFTKRVPPGAAGRGTLAELVAAQKAKADALGSAMGPQAIQHPMQGYAQIANTALQGFGEMRARNDLTTSRSELAKLLGGITDQASSEQIGQLSLYDPELAKQYRQDAVQARADAAARAEAARLHEDTQAQELLVQSRGFGQQTSERVAGQGFTTDERVAGQDYRTNERVGPGGTQEFQTNERKATEGFQGGQNDLNRDANAELQEQRINADADAAELTRKFQSVQPNSPGAQVLVDYKNGHYGPVGSTDAIEARDIEFANQTSKGAGTQIIMPGETPDLWKEFDKKMGGNFANYIVEGATAGSQLGALDILDQISPDSQGPLVGALAKRFPQFSTQAALFESIVKNFAPKERVEGSGSTSDIEYAGMLKSWPDISNLPEANRAISAAIRARANIAIERAGLIRQMRSGKLGMDDGYAKLGELDTRSILTPELKKIIADLSMRTPPAPGEEEKDDHGGWF